MYVYLLVRRLVDLVGQHAEGSTVDGPRRCQEVLQGMVRLARVCRSSVVDQLPLWHGSCSGKPVGTCRGGDSEEGGKRSGLGVGVEVRGTRESVKGRAGKRG